MSRLLFFALVMSCVLLGAVPARATPNFPGAVQRFLGASQTPPCSLCHLCGITGRGTVNTPWGVAMRARGLTAYDEPSLSAALASMERDKVDSDGDGVIDVDAVRMGKDPNPSETCEDDTIPRYGCVGRISSAPPRANSAWLLMSAIALFAMGRRSRRHHHRMLALTIASGVLASCASGRALTPRAVDCPEPPSMQPVVPSTMEGELAAAGLDPGHLPAFEEIRPKELRRVMSTFTRSLGVPCTGCHDASDYRLPTWAKRITIQMWNQMTRPYSVEHKPLFCDSCHHGQARFLDRRDKKTVSAYMTVNYTDRLDRHDGSEVECATCHGEAFDPHILSKW